MQFLLDTGNPDEINEVKSWNLICGVTTNPKIYGRLGTDFMKRLDQIVEASPGYVFTQVIGWHNTDEMVAQARWLATRSEKIVVKFPMCIEGLAAMGRAKKDNPEMTAAVTAVASPWQALLCGKAQADIVALFDGALDTESITPVELVAPVRQIFTNYGFKTKILSCGRFPRGIAEFAQAGSDFCTAGMEFLRGLYDHAYTDKRMHGFMDDWQGAFGDAKWPMA